ncbi:hypothetical protein AMAG_19710 [Allomyces macrogynus ATCC 38327]|uniref:Thioredoxin domain-containing protein n=1 Tax=Allomyces macrogynus (strain ATCC 38327) TaxID=578462 RepID=A0A0L0SZ46_ALLM3|nr:hypothetical protein AMAG_19710 [Allomyces macrogynus ATCC 38327]|eukprot:KNE67781.1 hypothetical protein AMAG_19710 [Allomyces macrogynus ATCC 38327]
MSQALVSTHTLTPAHPSTMATRVHSFNQIQGAIASGSAVAVCFSAEWSGPSRAMAPVFDQLAMTTPGVWFLTCDIDSVPGVDQEYGVHAVPVFMFFKGGVKVNAVTGGNASAIQQAVNAL